MPSDLCKRCVHAKVCFNDKNLFGDVFIPGNPMLFDNRELFKKYEERKAKGFPCDNFLELVRCEDCKHRDDDDDFCTGRGYPNALVPDDGFCDKGERRE